MTLCASLLPGLMNTNLDGFRQAELSPSFLQPVVDEVDGVLHARFGVAVVYVLRFWFRRCRFSLLCAGPVLHS